MPLIEIKTSDNLTAIMKAPVYNSLGVEYAPTEEGHCTLLLAMENSIFLTPSECEEFIRILRGHIDLFTANNLTGE